MTLTEAMAFDFKWTSEGKPILVKGLNATDNILKKYIEAKDGTVPDVSKVAARLLLAESTASVVAGKTLRVAKPVAAPAKPTPPPAQPQAATPPTDFQNFLDSEPDDTAGLMAQADYWEEESKRAPLAMPKAVVPMGQKQADTPEWAVRLEKKLDAVLDMFQTIVSSAKTTAPAAGVGQGGGMLHIVKVKVTPKGDGKVGIDFYDDNPEHKYPEIRETRKSSRWANTLPAGLDISDEQVFKVDWDVTYKLSDNKTEKGNPYKDVVSITPRK